MTERYVAPTAHLANRLKHAAKDQTKRYANAQQIADYEYEQMTRIERAINILEPVELEEERDTEIDRGIADVTRRLKRAT